MSTVCASNKKEKKKVNDCGHSGREYGVLSLDHHGVPQKFQNAISSNDQAGSWVDRGEE